MSRRDFKYTEQRLTNAGYGAKNSTIKAIKMRGG